MNGRLLPIEGMEPLSGRGDRRASRARCSTPSRKPRSKSSSTSTSPSRGRTRPGSVARCSPSAARPRWRCGSSPPRSPPTRSSASRRPPTGSRPFPAASCSSPARPGSGKSTTLASIIDRINETRAVHILTIEDPVEYVHHHKMSAVSQREVGLDSPSFDRALRSALREDPDVLLIGEMRDIESIQIALTMAETGHLVFGTLHTNDAPQAIDRIIDVFPAWRQEQTRVQLASSLAAVVAQRLVPRVGRRDGGRLRGARGHEPGAQPDPREPLQPVAECHDDELEGRHADPGDEPRGPHRGRHHHLRGGARRDRAPEGAGARARPAGLGRRLRSDPSCPIEADPPLPYSVVAAVTPCPGGWLVASAKLHAATFAPEDPRVLAKFAEVFEERPQFDVIALNAPIGYPDDPEEGRTCDRAARKLLGRRAMTVRNAPTRETVESGLVRLDERLDAVSLVLLAALRRGRGRDAAVPPAHRLRGPPRAQLLRHQLGHAAQALEAHRGGRRGAARAAREADPRHPPRPRLRAATGCRRRTSTTSAALLWTARRIFAKAATRIPEHPEWDTEGLRREIVR